MTQRISGTARWIMTAVLVVFVSGCSTLGFEGSPQQRAEAQAVHLFDESRAPFGQRIALAQSSYKPRLYGLNPYFGR